MIRNAVSRGPIEQFRITDSNQTSSDQRQQASDMLAVQTFTIYSA